mgnify:FL=1
MARGYKKSDNLTKDILLTLAQVGIFAVACTSPYTGMAIIKYYFKKHQRERARRLKELEKRKLINFEYLPGDEVRVTLTHRGKKLVRQYKLDEIKLQKPKVWDKKWRLIIYDIPIGQKNAARAMRVKLKDMGLYQLQKSVWVSPYECIAELEFICSVFELDMNQYIYYIKTAEIPKTQEIKKFFEL